LTDRWTLLSCSWSLELMLIIAITSVSQCYFGRQVATELNLLYLFSAAVFNIVCLSHEQAVAAAVLTVVWEKGVGYWCFVTNCGMRLESYICMILMMVCESCVAHCGVLSACRRLLCRRSRRWLLDWQVSSLCSYYFKFWNHSSPLCSTVWQPRYVFNSSKVECNSDCILHRPAKQYKQADHRASVLNVVMLI